MPDIADTYFANSLKPLHRLSDSTTLCIYEPVASLYVTKVLPAGCRAMYDAVSQIRCANIAPIAAIIADGDTVTVCREYISGCTVTDMMHRCGGSLSELQAARIICGVCAGLDELHRRGLVHRDINPNNILVSSDGVAKIIDFGIARRYREGSGSDTVILGTPGYAAPEQFGFTQSDARTDIYAVGVMLNVMLTGQLPNILHAGGRLGCVVDRCIAIDADKRYSDTISVMRDVQLALGESAPVTGSGRHGPIDSIIAAIPGIRSKKTSVVVWSVIGYVIAAMMLYTACVSVVPSAVNYVRTAVSILLTAVIPFFCFNNFLGVYNLLPFTRRSSESAKKLMFRIFGSISLLVGLFIFAYTPSMSLS